MRIAQRCGDGPRPGIVNHDGPCVQVRRLSEACRRPKFLDYMYLCRDSSKDIS